MLSSPSFCCLCIDLRVGCIILSLLQVLCSSFCVTTKIGEALNGNLLAQANIVVASIAGLLGLCGLVGSVQRKSGGVHIFSCLLLFKLFLGPMLVITQLSAIYLAYKHGCVESPELEARVCQEIPSVLVAMVVGSALGYIIDLHYYFVARTYAESLNECTEEGYTAVPVSEPSIPAYSKKAPLDV
ncbi:hypothetical protein DSO57_1021523 [Entomophthora muscae]|uniref:Uncharacterized protein n=1 Tax=Entomophthora muscae TaxID=34485 RepID=A0ACC2TR31_9FUNG|nr:hypothetical protein DSO57_1021523 [Entomophthora muscae]